jgi:hypothetical protein
MGINMKENGRIMNKMDLVILNYFNKIGIYYVLKDESKFEGNWKNGLMQGKGKWSKKDENFEGEFRNSDFEGYGVYYYNNGNRYEGLWSYSNKHGKGIFLNKL